MTRRRPQSNNGMHPTPLHDALYEICAGARVMPGVGQLSLTNMTKLSLSILILFALLSASLAQRQRPGGSAALVKKGKSAVFISFMHRVDLTPLRTGYGRGHLIFRITNNTREAVWLDMSDVPSNQYGDASLYYTIEETKGGIVRINHLCHVCSVNPVGPGRSVVFAIPRDYASQGTLLRIPYTFGSERDSGSSSTHSAEFYFDRLPKSRLPVVGAVQQIGRERNQRVC
jgi:hypothetical protein